MIQVNSGAALGAYKMKDGHLSIVTGWLVSCLPLLARQVWTFMSLVGVCLICHQGEISAAPLLNSHVGGLAIVGPATAHPASAFYNPAALSLLPGNHLFLDGTLNIASGYIDRLAIDHQTGEPRIGEYLPRQDFFKLFPHMFFSASSDLGSDTVVLALTVHTPFAEQFSVLKQTEDDWFDPTIQGPTRYQATEFSLVHLFSSIAASLKIADEFSLGASFAYVFGRTHFGVVRDTALDTFMSSLNDAGTLVQYESDTMAEALRVKGTSHGIGFAIGVLVRPNSAWNIGLGYVTRVVGISGADVTAQGDAWVRTASGDNLKGRGTIQYSLPDQVYLEASYQMTPRLRMESQFSWLNFSLHNQLIVRLTGSQFREQAAVLDRITYYRGFRDIYGFQIGGEYQLTEKLALQAASKLESKSVSSSAVTAIAIDALKVDSFVSLRWLLGRHFTLRSGYGLIFMPTIKVADSIFHPSAIVDCAQQHYDVDLPACQEAAAGQALPSAAGHYWQLSHRFSLSIAYDF